MRLDFDSLNLPSPSRDLIPDTNGNIVPIGPYLCRDAFFQVESPNNNGRIPTLCGNNNGQHIYVPVNASRGERELVIKIVNNVASNNNNGNSVSWKIKITQIECPNIQKHQNSLRVWEDSLIKAPDGCLQYHQAPSGTIRSLGYNTAGTSASNHYEANLNYAICFRRINDMCGIDFNVDEFQLGGIYDTDGSEVTSGTPSWCNVPILTGSTIYRDADYLFIPNGVYISVDSSTTPSTATSANEDRYCGNLVANTVIRSVTPGPFYIYFKTDNQVLGPNNDPYPTADTEISAPTADPENGWELTYNTLYGSSCGSLV